MVVNNQVGFTTEPADSRSSAHATDVAKAIGAPVLQCAPACHRPVHTGAAGHVILEVTQEHANTPLEEAAYWSRSQHRICTDLTSFEGGAAV